MIFSGCSYSELPISSTRYMYLTYNGSKKKIILTSRRTALINLNTIEFRENLGIYKRGLVLNINPKVDIILNTIDFKENSCVHSINLNINKQQEDLIL